MGVQSPTAFARVKRNVDEICFGAGEIFYCVPRMCFCLIDKYMIINELQGPLNMCKPLGNMYNLGNMYRMRARLPGLGCLLLLLLTSGAISQSSAGTITVRAIAELSQGAKLAPAKRVVSGDRVLYTLEVRNTAPTTAAPPRVDYAIPAHTWYVTESAVGPGTEITYSVDGGLSFDRPENLKMPGTSGEIRNAVATDYTHIRWQFKNSLKANSVAFVRFRVLVK
jgi:uncharacterized repeat protein (TIGR01451 family)